MIAMGIRMPKLVDSFQVIFYGYGKTNDPPLEELRDASDQVVAIQVPPRVFNTTLPNDKIVQFTLEDDTSNGGIAALFDFAEHQRKFDTVVEIFDHNGDVVEEITFSGCEIQVIEHDDAYEYGRSVPKTAPMISFDPTTLVTNGLDQGTEELLTVLHAFFTTLKIDLNGSTAQANDSPIVNRTVTLSYERRKDHFK